jgi:serine/threonine protein kinase
MLGRFSSLATYKHWILHLIDRLKTLHSPGIVHLDLRADNLVFSSDGQRLIIIDLEAREPLRGARCPRDRRQRRAGRLGMVHPIRHLRHWKLSKAWCMPANRLRSSNGESQPPPKPLSTRVCMRPDPGGRPTLVTLRKMVGSI